MIPKRYEFHPEGDVVLYFPCPTEESDAQPEWIKKVCKIDGRPDQTAGKPAKNDTTSLENSAKNGATTEDINMLVSSAHLKLASPVFRAMLQIGGFKEGNTLQTIGKVKIPLPDDNVDAFEVLMNVVHNRTRHIPREVDMECLTRLSVLVDKYQMAESLELCLDMWLPKLERLRPQNFSPKMLPWLSLSWIFNRADDFKYFTEKAILQSDGRLEAPLGSTLPFPNSAIDKIEETRQSCIESILSAIQGQINFLSGPENVCTYKPIKLVDLSRSSGLPPQTFSFGGRPPSGVFGSASGSSPPSRLPDDTQETRARRSNCDGMMLGTLLKNAAACGVWPLPPWPYRGLALSKMSPEPSFIRINSLCYAQGFNDGSSAFGSRSEAHGQELVLPRKYKEVIDGVTGLDIKVFKHPVRSRGYVTNSWGEKGVSDSEA